MQCEPPENVENISKYKRIIICFIFLQTFSMGKKMFISCFTSFEHSAYTILSPSNFT